MPFENGFGLEVLVGGRPCREYSKDGRFYIESDNQETSQVRILSQTNLGEIIEQAWPLTPFQIRVWVHKSRAQPRKSGLHCVYVDVDGSPLDSIVLNVGEYKIFEGFVDFQDGKEIFRECCFSLPRYVRDQDDRLDEERLDKVGTIRAKFYSAHTKRSPGHNAKPYHRPYVQANKRDAQFSAAGSYTPCTVMQGKVLGEKPSTSYKKWHFPDTLLCDLVIHYRTGHDLIEMGLKEAPAIVQENAGTAQTDAVKTEVCEWSPIKAEPVTEEVKQGQQTTVKQGQQTTVKQSQQTTVKQGQQTTVKQGQQTTVKQGQQTTVKQGQQTTVKQGQQTTVKEEQTTVKDENDNDVKPCTDEEEGKEFKLEPAYGLITLDSEVTSQTDDGYDVIEVTQAYVVINEEEEVYVVEDLVGPEVLQLD